MSTLRMPERGSSLVNVEGSPRTAAQWLELKAAFETHAAALERSSNVERAVGLLCLVAALLVLGLTDPPGWQRAVPACVFAVTLFGWLWLTGRSPAPHMYDGVESMDFKETGEDIYPQLLAKADAYPAIAKYLQSVIAQDRPLFVAERNALLAHAEGEAAAVQEKMQAVANASAKRTLQNLPDEHLLRVQDQRVAIEFYLQNPSAALFDFNKRFSREATSA